MEHLFIDSTIVRAHQHSAGAKKNRQSGNRPLARRAGYIAMKDCGGSIWLSMDMRR
jgi:hypothetical protein